MFNGPVTEPSPWQVEQLDLDAYLARIGAVAAPPSRSALDGLHEAHVRAFTFDNIDVLLDQHPGVALDAVQAKFVGRGRGGYCFEHGVLFAAALERLGYDVERRLGRVGGQARTHCVVLVTLDGERVLADPGFGMSVLRPIPLVDGAEDDYGGWRYQLREVPLGAGRSWTLQRWRRQTGHWELMHTHDELPVQPLDVTVGPPLHEHLPDHPLPQHADGHQTPRRQARGGDARDRDSTAPGRADPASCAPRRRAVGPAGRARRTADRRRATSPAGQGQPAASDSMTSATGQAPPIVLPMTVAVVPWAGWWADQKDTPASPPDMVISGESDFTQKPRP